ncbi:MAG: ABC transporter ATP-binding protein [Thermodesulfobacteriota bacterium]|nr:ABC transporter ATP-binding protein [Thermodesulfobacteriota bacterium]
MNSKDIAIKVEGISKCYRIGLKEQVHDSMGGAIINFIKNPLKNYRKYRSLYKFDDVKDNSFAESADIIWALRDVSFTVKKGEVLGIIGRNGTGKSTLLKILAKITDPTTGLAEIHGRVSSLLEVGTGFHPELTGRENIYLNGTILGMRKTEIDRKFDEIVDFSGVEKFMDTPVKRYSSGMRVRVAFAVAAYLEPEILIIDEVLAVGDEEFQKKCLGKMREVGQAGRTVLFVSHNMPAVTRLCSRTILLEEGQILKDGSSRDVISAYLGAETGTIGERVWLDPSKAPAGEICRLRAVRVRSEDGKIVETLDIRQPVKLEIEFEVLKPEHVLMPHYSIFNEEGIHLFSAHDIDSEWRGRHRSIGRYVSTVRVPGNFFAEGTMLVNVGVTTLNPNIPQFYDADAVAFYVVDNLEGDSARGDWHKHMDGVVRPMLEWSTEFYPQNMS